MCYHKKKILFLLPSFRKGGEAKNTLNILNALDTDYFDLHLLICSNKNNELKELIDNKVLIIEFKPSASVGIWFHFIKALWRIRPDITFTSFIYLSYLIGIYKLFFFRKIVNVLRFNTLPSNNISSDSSFKVSENRIKFSVKSADRIIAQSTEMCNEIIKYYPRSRGKVQVIFNAINHLQIARLSEQYIPYKEYMGTTLVAIGSLWQAKGFEFLVRAVEKLVFEYKREFRLFIVGENMNPDSGYDEYLQTLIKHLNLEKYIFLEGYTPNPYPYMKHADVFVLSSLKEGFPNVVLEALSLQIPCVVTNCVDFNDIIIPSYNGIIVRKADVDSLVEGILKASDIEFKIQENVDFDYNRWFTTLLN